MPQKVLALFRAKVRDVIVSEMPFVKQKKLASRAGMAEIKSHLIGKINESTGAGKVSALYLTDFLLE